MEKLNWCPVSEVVALPKCNLVRGRSSKVAFNPIQNPGSTLVSRLSTGFSVALGSAMQTCLLADVREKGIVNNFGDKIDVSPKAVAAYHQATYEEMVRVYDIPTGKLSQPFAKVAETYKRLFGDGKGGWIVPTSLVVSGNKRMAALPYAIHLWAIATHKSPGAYQVACVDLPYSQAGFVDAQLADNVRTDQAEYTDGDLIESAWALLSHDLELGATDLRSKLGSKKVSYGKAQNLLSFGRLARQPDLGRGFVERFLLEPSYVNPEKPAEGYAYSKGGFVPFTKVNWQEMDILLGKLPSKGPNKGINPFKDWLPCTVGVPASKAAVEDYCRIVTTNARPAENVAMSTSAILEAANLFAARPTAVATILETLQAILRGNARWFVDTASVAEVPPEVPEVPVKAKGSKGSKKGS